MAPQPRSRPPCRGPEALAAALNCAHGEHHRQGSPVPRATADDPLEGRRLKTDQKIKAAENTAHRTHWQDRCLEHPGDPGTREFDDLDAALATRPAKARSAFANAAEDRRGIRKGPGILASSKARYAAAEKRYAEFLEEWGEAIAPGPDATPDEIEALAVAAGTDLFNRDYDAVYEREQAIVENLASSIPEEQRRLLPELRA